MLKRTSSKKNLHNLMHQQVGVAHGDPTFKLSLSYTFARSFCFLLQKWYMKFDKIVCSNLVLFNFKIEKLNWCCLTCVVGSLTTG